MHIEPETDHQNTVCDNFILYFDFRIFRDGITWEKFPGTFLVFNKMLTLWVTNITDHGYIRGEKLSRGEKFRFLCITDVKKSEISPHLK